MLAVYQHQYSNTNDVMSIVHVDPHQGVGGAIVMGWLLGELVGNYYGTKLASSSFPCRRARSAITLVTILFILNDW